MMPNIGSLVILFKVELVFESRTKTILTNDFHNKDTMVHMCSQLKVLVTIDGFKDL